MRAVARSLAWRLWSAQIVVASAVATLAAVAAFVEGRVPSGWALLRAAIVPGVLLGAAWTLARWRSEGGDLALANAGVAPLATVLWLAALSLPPLAAGLLDGAARPPAWDLQTEPGRVRVLRPGAPPLDVAWSSGVARRSDRRDGFSGLAAPTTTTPPPVEPSAMPRFARAGALLALLAFLGLKRGAPGPAVTLVSALVATAIAQGATALYNAAP